MDNETNTETENNKHFSLYVLELEHGKYYVGITSRTPEFRMQQHINGFAGAGWTRKHKPIAMLSKEDLGSTTESEAKAREDLLTRELINKYGLDNVRGGDIVASGDLIKRFGRVFTNENWEVMTLIIFLILVILVLSLLVYTKR